MINHYLDQILNSPIHRHLEHQARFQDQIMQSVKLINSSQYHEYYQKLYAPLENPSSILRLSLDLQATMSKPNSPLIGVLKHNEQIYRSMRATLDHLSAAAESDSLLLEREIELNDEQIKRLNTTTKLIDDRLEETNGEQTIIVNNYYIQSQPQKKCTLEKIFAILMFFIAVHGHYLELSDHEDYSHIISSVEDALAEVFQLVQLPFDSIESVESHE